MQVPVNIGPHTQPETFIFRNNIWYNPEGNKIKVKSSFQEFKDFLNLNPALADSTYSLLPNSPAIGKGQKEKLPTVDYFGRGYAINRSIGAVEFFKPVKTK